METSPSLSKAVEIAPAKQALALHFLGKNARGAMSALMAAADLAGLMTAGLLAILLRRAFNDDFNNLTLYVRLLPMLGLFLLVYTLQKLYPGIGLTPVEELRRLSLATSAMILTLIAFTFWTQTSLVFSRLLLGLFWLLALAGVPLSRWLARGLAMQVGLWGEPVALIGFGPNGRKIFRFLKHNRRYGMNPVVVVNGYSARKEEAGQNDCPEIRADMLASHKDLLAQAGIRTAILVPPEIPQVLNEALLDEQQFGLRRLILISSLNWFGGSAVISHDLQGILGLEVERNLLNRSEQLLKRCLDWVLMIVSAPLLVPLLGSIAVLIKLDSPGPVLYRQKRVGHGGQALWIWKFRSMVPEADRILQDCLAKDEGLRSEWESNHKLKNDPRITRIGRLLRKTSLDELPQLWNVVRGEMSLVGPRPIVTEEIQHYATSYRLYTQVRPGLTGLWQVSGRSDTSYPHRVSLDEYYVRHWSVWLDLYILIRTLWVVFTRNGAY